MLKTPSYPEYGMNENKMEYRKAANQPLITINAHTEVSVRIWEETWDPARH